MYDPGVGSNLAILSGRADEYRALVAAAGLPGLDRIRTAPAPDCDVALGEPHLLRDALGALPGLRWAQCTWAGVEPLLDPALRRDYALTNARGVFGAQVAEYVFAHLLFVERRIAERLAAQRAERWDRSPPGALRGKTMGLLGVGSIGAELAATARRFGMTVLGYTRASAGCAEVDRYFHGDGLVELARAADVLVNTLPGTPATRGIVGAELLAALKRGAWLVNVGRGDAVDEPALIRALEEGALGGAILDVAAEEPLPAGHPLWRAPNAFVTCHTAALTDPAEIARLFAANWGRYLRGEPLRWVVDFERGY